MEQDRTWDTLRAKSQVALAELRCLPRSLAISWQAARAWTVAWVLLLLAGGLLPVAFVYLTRALVDRLVAALSGGAGWHGLAPLMALVLLFAGVALLGEGLRCATGWVRTAQSERIRDHIQDAIHAQAVLSDLAVFERPDFYDRLYRASWESAQRSVNLLETLGGLLQSAVTLLAMMGVILPYGWWLPLALLASTLPAFWIVIRYAIRQHAWWRSITTDERRVRYLDWLLTGPEAAPEIRLFDTGAHFRAAYGALRQKLREGRIDLERRQAAADFAASLLALVIAAVAMAGMLWRTVHGAFSLGDLALFLQAFRQGQSMMRSLIENVGKLYQNSLFLRALFEYLDLKPQIVAPASPRTVPPSPTQGVRFEDVRFAYPGSARLALDRFSMFIPVGKRVAIVGPNGAGKSTLIKLLCRLHDPLSGRITLDGIDLREFDPAELRRHITVLFQEPMRYHGTVEENIALADLARPAARAEIEAAARAAGAHALIASLPDGYATPLGRVYGEGAELSAGEWQRIALARAFLRRSPIVILDEPTSAMDPWAEVEWMSRLDQVLVGSTILIVTHRLSTARRVDLIYVLEGGHLRESGSHAELLARGGPYAAVWKAQTGWDVAQGDPEAQVALGGIRETRPGPP